MWARDADRSVRDAAAFGGFPSVGVFVRISNSQGERCGSVVSHLSAELQWTAALQERGRLARPPLSRYLIGRLRPVGRKIGGRRFLRNW